MDDEVDFDFLLLKFPDYRKLIEQVTSHLDGKRRCIDLGAGTGNNALRLLEDPDREVWAVATNETTLRRFRDRLANEYPPAYVDRLTIVQENTLRHDALPLASFDAAVMTSVLYAVRAPESCLRQVNRILKLGGILALSTPDRETNVDVLFDQLQESLNRQYVFDQFRELFDAARAQHDVMLDRIHRDSIDDIRRILDEAGFQVEGEPVAASVRGVVVIKAVKVSDPIVRVPAAPAHPGRAEVGRLSLLVRAARPSCSSGSTEDKEIADRIRAYLEDQAISCWVSSRDIQSSQNYAAAIVQAINRSRLMVLILSPFANRSEPTPREVALAAKRRIPIIPFRAKNVDPSEALAYYLSNVHWLDAFSPLSQHLPRLGGTVKSLLSTLAGAAVEAEDAKEVC